MSALLDAGADIEASMHGNGWTPLFVAAWAGNHGVVGVLLRAAANPTAEMMLAVSLATGLLIAPPVSPGASRRVTKMRMAYTGERIALGTHVATLEGRCDSGDDSACTMLDQLAGSTVV